MSINHIKTAIQKKGWYFCLSEAYKRLFPIRWVKNLKIIGLIHEWRSFSYLKRKYEPSLLNFHPDNVETQDDSNKRIWVLWLQGEENSGINPNSTIFLQQSNSNVIRIGCKLHLFFLEFIRDVGWHCDI